MKQTVLLFVLSLTAIAFAEGYSIKPQHVEKDPQIIVEPDQTDIFAIPLDEDAEDQQEELYQLQHPRNKR